MEKFLMADKLAKKFLEHSVCYFCNDDIHNYELVTLFDERNVKSCFECYNRIEIERAMYYCKIGEVDISWELEDV